MKKQSALRLGEILPECVKDLNIEDRLQRTTAEQLWFELMGERMRVYTRSVFVKDRILIVKLNSSVFRQEMLLNKQTILERLHATMKNDYIKDIVFQ